jgi:uncharacterized membrane protein HdeD (DUF308 family)
MIVLFWILSGILSGILANRYKRNAAGWAILGFLIGVFAPLILLALGEDKSFSKWEE